MRKGLSLAYQGLNTMVRSSSVFFSLLLCDMFIFSEFAVACSCLALCVFLRGACDGRLGVSALWMRVDLIFFTSFATACFFHGIELRELVFFIAQLNLQASTC